MGGRAEHPLSVPLFTLSKGKRRSPLSERRSTLADTIEEFRVGVLLS